MGCVHPPSLLHFLSSRISKKTINDLNTPNVQSRSRYKSQDRPELWGYRSPQPEFVGGVRTLTTCTVPALLPCSQTYVVGWSQSVIDASFHILADKIHIDCRLLWWRCIVVRLYYIIFLWFVFLGRRKCEAIACLSSQVKCNFYELLYCALYLWRINLIWSDLIDYFKGQLQWKKIKPPKL